MRTASARGAGLSADPSADPATQLADRLHSAAIHLLRGLRGVDTKTGLSGPRLSALSVVVFGGPLTLGELAAAEQVKPPTMTRLVRALEVRGLVAREADEHDGRIVRLRATARGRKLMMEGRARRVSALADGLRALDDSEVQSLEGVLDILERIVHRLQHKA
jgi:DNA-binding MarR family transcriptional regulator